MRGRQLSHRGHRAKKNAVLALACCQAREPYVFALPLTRLSPRPFEDDGVDDYDARRRAELDATSSGRRLGVAERREVDDVLIDSFGCGRQVALYLCVQCYLALLRSLCGPFGALWTKKCNYLVGGVTGAQVLFQCECALRRLGSIIFSVRGVLCASSVSFLGLVWAGGVTPTSESLSLKGASNCPAAHAAWELCKSRFGGQLRAVSVLHLSP